MTGSGEGRATVQRSSKPLGSFHKDEQVIGERFSYALCTEIPAVGMSHIPEATGDP